jgi:hypothetical protein
LPPSILERFVAGPELVEDHLAVGTILRIARERIALVVEPDLLAVAELHRRSRDVRGRELIANVVRPGKRGSGRRQQLFLAWGQSVLGQAEGVAQAEREPLLQYRIRGDEGVDLGGAQSHDFRIGPRRRLAKGSEDVLRLLLAFLVGGDPPVFVRLEGRIGVKARGPLADVRLGHERSAHGRSTSAERALLRLQRRNRLQQCLPFGFPRGIARIELRQIPCRSCGCGLRHRHSRYSSSKRRGGRRRNQFAT